MARNPVRTWWRGVSFGVALGWSAGAGLGLGLPLGTPNSEVRAQAPAGIAWMTNLEQARQAAAVQGRPILVHFWNDNCPPCVAVERNVFSRPEVERALANGFVAVKIKVDDAPDVARWFKIDRWPTDLVLTADGKELLRTTSPQDPTRYVAMLAHVGGMARTEAPAALQTLGQAATGAAAQAQAQVQQQANQYATQANQQTNQFAAQANQQAARYASQATGAVAAATGGAFVPPGGGSFRAETPPDMPAAPAALAPQAGPYGGAPAASGNFASQTSAPGAAPGGAFVAGFGGRPGFGGRAAPAAPTTTPANPAPAPAPAAAAPTGGPSLAMDGYCTVTLMEQHAWKRGDVRWGAVHRDRTYLFASQEDQQKFLANPDRYAPMLSGFDPVIFAQYGKLVPGRRQHGVWFQEQMYLFVDEASLERFRSSPASFAGRAEQAMRGGANQTGSVTR